MLASLQWCTYVGVVIDFLLVGVVLERWLELRGSGHFWRFEIYDKLFVPSLILMWLSIMHEVGVVATSGGLKSG